MTQQPRKCIQEAKLIAIDKWLNNTNKHVVK